MLTALILGVLLAACSTVAQDCPEVLVIRRRINTRVVSAVVTAIEAGESELTVEEIQAPDELLVWVAPYIPTVIRGALELTVEYIRKLIHKKKRICDSKFGTNDLSTGGYSPWLHRSPPSKTVILHRI